MKKSPPDIRDPHSTEFHVLTKVLSHLPLLVSYMDRSLKYLYVNEAYEKWFGISKEKCLQSTMVDVVGEEGVKKVQPYLDKVLSGEKQEFTAEIPYKLGPPKTIHVQYLPDFGSTQKVIGIIVLVEDITTKEQEKKTKLELDKTNAEFSTMITESPMGIIRLNSQYQYMSANPAYQKLLGYTEDELKQKTILDVTHPEDYLQTLNTIKSFPQSKQPLVRFEKRYIHKNGKTVWARVTSRFLEDEDKPGTFISIIEDITELKQTQQETLTLVEMMSEGLVIQDKDGKIQKFNPSALKILGLDENQLLGRTSMDPRWKSIKEDGSPFPGDEHPAMVALKSNASVKNQVMGLSLPNGAERWIAINAVPIETNEGRKVICTFGDITKIIQANRDLNSFFNHSKDLICVAGIDGKFKKINPSFLNVLGWNESELMTMPYLDLVHPKDIPATTAEISKIAAGATSIHFENRLRTKNGEYRILSWVCEADLKTKLMYASGRDITNQKIEESRNRQILKALDKTAIVAFTDNRGKITQANEHFCKISGYTKSELLGKDHRILNANVHTKKFFESLWDTIKSGNPWSGEITNKTKSGQLYHVRTVITPIFSIDGDISEFMAIRFDITDQKRAESMLRNFEAVIENSRDFIGITGPNKNPIYINPWGRILLGLPEKGALDTVQIDTLYSGENTSSLLFDIESGIATSGYWEGNTEIWRLGKQQKVPVRSTHFLIKDPATGKHLGEAIVLRDISKETESAKVAEESQKRFEIERAKSLHSAKLASLGEMSVGIAHEINNPLAIISGNLQFLSKYRLDSEKFDSKLQSVSRATQRIEKIVNGLRRFSRYSETAPFKLEPFFKIIDEAIAITEPKAKRIFAKVSSEIPKDLEVNCDYVELEQVFVNLISNALDAVKTLDDKWVKIEVESKSDQVIVRVLDSGSGISEQTEKKLFQPFFTTKSIGEGTGLGLSIVKGILDQHNALIFVNHDFENTCFEIRFQNQIHQKKVS